MYALLYLTPTGNRILVQCYSSHSLGIPSEEKSHPSREWCKKWIQRLFKLQLLFSWLSPLFLCAVNTSDNKKQLERGLHGEDWPDGPSFISFYNKHFFIFVISLGLIRQWFFRLYSFLATCNFISVCLFMCVFSNGSHSRNGGSHCAQWAESFCILNLLW